jgi:hypothetical protein
MGHYLTHTTLDHAITYATNEPETAVIHVLTDPKLGPITTTSTDAAMYALRQGATHHLTLNGPKLVEPENYKPAPLPPKAEGYANVAVFEPYGLGKRDLVDVYVRLVGARVEIQLDDKQAKTMHANATSLINLPHTTCAIFWR